MRYLAATMAAAAALWAVGCTGEEDVEYTATRRWMSPDMREDMRHGYPRIGFTQTDVRKTLGEPDALKRYITDNGHHGELWSYYKVHKCTIEFVDGVVTSRKDNSISQDMRKPAVAPKVIEKPREKEVEEVKPAEEVKAGEEGKAEKK
jgi:hypothetical protein